jgi:uncharacterized membrane protein YphA (DoxX/SURF4 family)
MIDLQEGVLVVAAVVVATVVAAAVVMVAVAAMVAAVVALAVTVVATVALVEARSPTKNTTNYQSSNNEHLGQSWLCGTYTMSVCYP